MYAIVKTGGKQYRVEQGQKLLVEKLALEAGDSLDLEPLFVGGDGDSPVFDKTGLGKAKVGATVVEHVKGPKLTVFKFKPKRGYKRKTGHRQNLTRIEITTITAG